MQHKISIRRHRSGHVLVEFAALLPILLFFIMFPLIDLCAMATRWATVALITNEAASQAASQPDFSSALQSVVRQSNQSQNSGLAQFASIKAVGGIQNCGMNLSVLASNYHTSSTMTFTPNVAVPPPIDTSTYLYEYVVESRFEVQPFVDLSKIPLIADIGGLGKPTELIVRAAKAVEHPEGLDDWQNSRPTPDQNISKLDRSIIVTTPASNNSGWNYPDIYQAIAARGEQVVSENVLTVYANNYQWADTQCAAQPGENVWFDFRADGQWNSGYPFGIWAPLVGPAGYPATPTCPGLFNLPFCALIGRMNSSGTPFLVGPGLYDWKPTSTGEVLLRNNDYDTAPAWFADDVGSMQVRVIVTR